MTMMQIVQIATEQNINVFDVPEFVRKQKDDPEVKARMDSMLVTEHKLCGFSLAERTLQVLCFERDVLKRKIPILTLSDDQCETFSRMGVQVLKHYQDSPISFTLEKYGIVPKLGNRICLSMTNRLSYFDFENGFVFSDKLDMFVHRHKDQWCFLPTTVYEPEDRESSRLIGTFLLSVYIGVNAFLSNKLNVLVNGPIQNIPFFKKKKGKMSRSKLLIQTLEFEANALTPTMSSHYRRGHLRFLVNERYKEKRFQFVPVAASVVNGKGKHVVNMIESD